MAYILQTRASHNLRNTNLTGLLRFVTVVAFLSFVVLVGAHIVQIFGSSENMDLVVQRIEKNAAFVSAFAVCVLILRGVLRGFQRNTA